MSVLGPKIEPKPKADTRPEWLQIKPGLFKHRDTGKYETWTDPSGKPMPGTPPSTMPHDEDDYAFIPCF